MRSLRCTLIASSIRRGTWPAMRRAARRSDIDAVLGDAGFSREETDRLRRDGVISAQATEGSEYTTKSGLTRRGSSRSLGREEGSDYGGR